MELFPGSKISVSWSWFWFKKFQQQRLNIKNRTPEDPTREEPEMALGYFFLYQWLESFIDDIVGQFYDYLYPVETISKFEKYKKKRLYLKGKVELIFDNFCSELSYQNYVQLKNAIEPFNKIRNLIVHLHEISWIVDNEGKTEQPKSTFARLLKRKNLESSYEEAIDFLVLLKVTLLKSHMGQQKMTKHLLGIDSGPTVVEQVFNGWLPDEVKEKIEHKLSIKKKTG